MRASSVSANGETLESSFSAIGKRARAVAGGGVGNEALLRTDRKTRESVKKEDHFGGRENEGRREGGNEGNFQGKRTKKDRQRNVGNETHLHSPPVHFFVYYAFNKSCRGAQKR